MLRLLLALGSLHAVAGLELPVDSLKSLYAVVCPYVGCAMNDLQSESELFPVEMPLQLEGEDSVRTYPAFPHSPLLVAAGACDAVVLRWRSFEERVWPVERFVLQRFSDGDDQPKWNTLLNENATDLVDLQVQPGRKYAYRVQAVSTGNVSSAYAYHWTDVDAGSSMICRSTGVLLSSVGTLNADGIRSLGLIFACFLTVYGLMRANVMSVQGTQSRSYRLKRIKKSTTEVVSPAGVSMMPRRSSTSTSSSSPSVEVDPSQRGSSFEATPSTTNATAGGLMRAHSTTDPMFRQDSYQTPTRPISRSIGAIDEKAQACHYCGKRFGLFRKRYMCDICHSVSVCRKCGYQASVDSFANARTGMQMHSEGTPGGRGMGHRRSSLSQQQQKKLKIRTICRNCCDEMYRYSTHASVRPSYVNSGNAPAIL